MNEPKLTPDINRIKEILEELNALDYRQLEIEDFGKYINELMIGYVVNLYYFNHGLVLFRGVGYKEKPSIFENLIYPPLSNTKINRASDSNEQMFYASTSKRAVFYELNAKRGDRLAIATWKTNNVLFFNNVGYTKLNFEALSSTRQPLDSPPDVGNSIIVGEYLAKFFCQPVLEANNYLYKMTIAIARIHLQNVTNNKFSGLFYPTVQMNAEEENFALLKETIDRNLLDFESVEFIEIIDKIENRYKYKIIDVADNLNGNDINWKNLDKNWIVFDDSDELFFTKESGQFVAYDENGDIVEPD
jgi:hypothetical protein